MAVRDEMVAARAESQQERNAIMEETIAQVQGDRLDGQADATDGSSPG